MPQRRTQWVSAERDVAAVEFVVHARQVVRIEGDGRHDALLGVALEDSQRRNLRRARRAVDEGDQVAHECEAIIAAGQQ